MQHYSFVHLACRIPSSFLLQVVWLNVVVVMYHIPLRALLCPLCKWNSREEKMNLPQVWIFPERFGNVRLHRLCVCAGKASVQTLTLRHAVCFFILFLFFLTVTHDNKKLKERQFSFEMLYQKKKMLFSFVFIMCGVDIYCLLQKSDRRISA